MRNTKRCSSLFWLRWTFARCKALAKVFFTFQTLLTSFKCTLLCSLAVLSRVEEAAIGVLSSLVLRLSETAFRPMFLMLAEWGLHAEAAKTRRVAFHRAVDGLAGMLKGLFVPYYSNLLKPMAEALSVR